jgi:hypothetical protein
MTVMFSSGAVVVDIGLGLRCDPVRR